MIEKIELDNPIDFIDPYLYHDEIAKKINEIIDVVNKLDVEVQKMPPASKIHMDLFGKRYEY